MRINTASEIYTKKEAIEKCCEIYPNVFKLQLIDFGRHRAVFYAINSRKPPALCWRMN
jgi:hypothetical protein